MGSAAACGAGYGILAGLCGWITCIIGASIIIIAICVGLAATDIRNNMSAAVVNTAVGSTGILVIAFALGCTGAAVLDWNKLTSIRREVALVKGAWIVVSITRLSTRIITKATVRLENVRTLAGSNVAAVRGAGVAVVALKVECVAYSGVVLVGALVLEA